MKWIINETPAWKRRIYSKKFNISSPLAKTLINRNITLREYDKLNKAPEEYLENPKCLPNAEKVAAHILKLVKEKYEFNIFSDYDVDGLTSGFIMMDYLKSLNATVKLHYPERKDGYGISLDFCTDVVKRQKNTGIKQAVITTDNGITANKEMVFLKANKIEAIITDHHEPLKNIPNVLYCDPYADPNGYGFHLAGVAVAWKICSLINELSNNAGKNPYEYLPYVATGTVADVMPMTLENIALIKMGLKIINKDRPEPFNTIMELNNIKNLTAKDLGWTVGPLLNAASRMGDVWSAGKLFVTDPTNRNNKDTEIESMNSMVVNLMALNIERKKKTDSITKKAMKQDYSSDHIIIFNSDNGEEGISGIVANKLMEKYNKPALVYSGSDKEIISASARSPYGMDIFNLLDNEVEKNHIKSYGGHIEAFGVKLIHDKINDFHKDMNKKIEKALNTGEIKISEPSLNIDGEIYIEDISKKTLNEIKTIPYDKDKFPEPVFVIKDVTVTIEQPYSNKEHIVLKCTDKRNNKITLVSWESKYSYSKYVKLGKPTKIDIAGTISDVGFSDKTTGRRATDVTLVITDIRPASA